MRSPNHSNFIPDGILPTFLGDPDEGRIQAGDSVIFFNFLADRARQLTRAFVLKDFDGFEPKAWPQPLGFVTLSKVPWRMSTGSVMSGNSFLSRSSARTISATVCVG